MGLMRGVGVGEASVLVFNWYLGSPLFQPHLPFLPSAKLGPILQGGNFRVGRSLREPVSPTDLFVGEELEITQVIGVLTLCSLGPRWLYNRNSREALPNDAGLPRAHTSLGLLFVCSSIHCASASSHALYWVHSSERARPRPSPAALGFVLY